MSKNFIRNTLVWIIYSVVIYALLLPYGLYVEMIPIAVISGFFLGMLNDIRKVLIDIKEQNKKRSKREHHSNYRHKNN